eukprot:5100829-Amphidinium_carterae.1
MQLVIQAVRVAFTASTVVASLRRDHAPKSLANAIVGSGKFGKSSILTAHGQDLIEEQPSMALLRALWTIESANTLRILRHVPNTFHTYLRQKEPSLICDRRSLHFA